MLLVICWNSRCVLNGWILLAASSKNLCSFLKMSHLVISDLARALLSLLHLKVKFLLDHLQVFEYLLHLRQQSRRHCNLVIHLVLLIYAEVRDWHLWLIVLEHGIALTFFNDPLLLELFQEFAVLVLDLYKFLDFSASVSKLLNLTLDRLSFVVKDSVRAVKASYLVWALHCWLVIIWLHIALRHDLRMVVETA